MWRQVLQITGELLAALGLIASPFVALVLAHAAGLT